MNKNITRTRTILTKTLAAGALAASLLGLGAGVADARPSLDSIRDNCNWLGGRFQVFYHGSSFLGSSCTTANYRYSWDRNDLMYLEEQRVKGKWQVVWGRD